MNAVNLRDTRKRVELEMLAVMQAFEGLIALLLFQAVQDNCLLVFFWTCLTAFVRSRLAVCKGTTTSIQIIPINLINAKYLIPNVKSSDLYFVLKLSPCFAF